MKEEAEQIVNRVANSPLVTFDLEEFYPNGERVAFDLHPQLYQGLILKEKEFREFVRTHDWSGYQGKFVAITCSADAIIPTWAYMLVGLALEPYARYVTYGSLEDLESYLFNAALDKVNWNDFEGKKIVIKGCSRVDVPLNAYVQTANRLRKVASSVMFGEACSTVPLYKKRLEK